MANVPLSGPGAVLSAGGDKYFAFTSRPYGRVLLGVLSLVLLLFVLVTAYMAWMSTGSATTLSPFAETAGLWLDGTLTLLFLFNIVIFLVWMYRVHQDLGRLIPDYPISPREAVVKSAIPVYGVVGLGTVFKEMSEKFQPSLELWARFVPGVYTVSIATIFADLNLPDWVYQGWWVVVAGVWLFSTLAVHRALAARVGELLPEPPIAVESNELGPEGTLADDAPIDGTPKKGGRFSPRLRTGLIIALLAAGAISFLAIFGPIFMEVRRTTAEMNLYDENFDQLASALSERWDPDDSIPAAGVFFGFFGSSGEDTEVWLNIELETTETCQTGPGNPCEQLVDEFAAIALTNYPRIDEMAGLRVSVTRTIGNDTVSVETGVDKSMTIDEWRQELGLLQSQLPHRYSSYVSSAADAIRPANLCVFARPGDTMWASLNVS